MACNSCGKKKKTCDNKEFTKAVVEINNPETNVLIRKVVIPTSLGDDITNPPSIGRYCNVVLYYEANQHIYLYSSDGIPTLISDNGDVDFNYIQNRPWYNGAPMTSDTRIPKVPTAVSELNNDRNYQTASQVSGTVNTAVAGEKTARQNADNTLQTNINNEKTARQNADTTLQNNITAEATARGNADTALQNSINAEVLARQDAINTLTTEINRDVMYDLEMTTSASSVSFKEDKINVVTGVTKTETDTLPAASTTTAGIITAAEYATLVDSEEKINALLDGAVAITGISASPSQQDLTDAWKNATGRDELINRASIFDVDNQLVWTYYTNVATWEATPAGGQITINQFENGVAGTIVGSTLDGNVSANLDGTGSVSGWTTVKNDIAANTAAIATKANITDIPTVNNATLTIQKNGSNVATFTANSATNATANITVPTKTSDLTNDSNFVNTTQLATKQDVLTAGNAIDIANNVISANVHPADFFTSDATDSDKGNPLYFEGTTEEKLANIMLEGDTDQTTYSGKNLTPYPYTGGGNNRGITFTAAEDGTVTLNGQNDNTGASVYFLFRDASSPIQFNAGTYYFIVPSDTSVQFVMYDGTSWYNFNSAANYTKTLPSTLSIREIYIQVPKGNPTNFNNLKIYPMLSTLPNQTSADYEPYVGGIASPNPDYPQNVDVVTGEQTIKVTGKNLLNCPPYATTSHGIATTRNNDGSYTLSGTIDTNWATATNIFNQYLPSGNYTISKSKVLPFDIVLRVYNADTGVRTDYVLDKNASSRTIYINYKISGFMWFISSATTGTTYDETFFLQLEKGSVATEIEPSQFQEYKVNLGKNLLPITDGTISGHGMTATVSNGVLTVNGTADSNIFIKLTNGLAISTSNEDSWRTASFLPNLNGYTYTQQYVSGGYQASGTAFRLFGPTTTYIRQWYPNNTKQTFTWSESTDAPTVLCLYINSGISFNNSKFNLQLEKGNSSTTIVPYKTHIELCKIGDYQDYFYKDGDDWYIHKELGKLILNGTGDYGTLGDGTGGTKRFRFNESTVGNIDVQTRGVYSDRYQGVRYSASPSTPNSISQWRQENMLAVTTNKTTYSLNDFKADLASNPVTVYYVLATATNTQITDSSLIEQLDTLWNGAHSYDGETWLSAQSNGVDLPFILDATVVRDGLAGLRQIIDEKQDPVIAGDNITITDNVISATVPTVNNATLTIQKNGTNVATFTANSSTNATANITVPTITMTSVDPGEGSPLAANNFIAVYEA